MISNDQAIDQRHCSAYLNSMRKRFAEEENLKKDKVIFVADFDWWDSKFEEIPPEAKHQILLDKRPQETGKMVKQNRDQGSIKYDIWQKRPEFIQTMKSRTNNNDNLIHNLDKYILTITTLEQKKEQKNLVVEVKIDDDCDWYENTEFEEI